VDEPVFDDGEAQLLVQLVQRLHLVHRDCHTSNRSRRGQSASRNRRRRSLPVRRGGRDAHMRSGTPARRDPRAPTTRSCRTAWTTRSPSRRRRAGARAGRASERPLDRDATTRCACATAGGPRGTRLCSRCRPFQR
jgi:hypothetical protein